MKTPAHETLLEAAHAAATTPVPWLDDGDVRLYEGDCIEAMRALPADSIDAIITDPPYGIGFMGHEWDQPGEYGPVGANGTPGMGEREGVRRRKQPSAQSGAGHARERVLLGGPTGKDNTKHTLRGGAMHAGRYDLSLTANRRYQAWCESWAIECLRILKPGGHLVAFCSTRTTHRLASGVEDAGFEIRDTLAWLFGQGFPKSKNLEGDWDGWGTALKPGHEPVTLARKPFKGTVASNALEHGTGALNIDACRIASDYQGPRGGEASAERRYDDKGATTFTQTPGPRGGAPEGRWPANVILDPEAAAMLDAQTGTLVSGPESDKGHRRNADREAQRNTYGGFHGDKGGASRFFYTAKAAASERTEPGGVPNTHPTVKPVDLMRWLIRLLAPPGATILDPFGGSGTTGVAARAENVKCILIEREADYLPIIASRLRQGSLFG